MAELVPTGQEDRFIQKLADHYDTFNIKLAFNTFTLFAINLE
jgi:hypothetical protein